MSKYKKYKPSISKFIRTIPHLETELISRIHLKIGGAHNDIFRCINYLEDESFLTKKKVGRNTKITLTKKGKKLKHHAEEIIKLINYEG